MKVYETMKLRALKIWLVCVVTYIFFGYFLHQNTTIPMRTNFLIDVSLKARTIFLNNTFCGQFITGTWNETISKVEIEQRNQFLKDRNNQSEIEYENLSCSKFIIKYGFYSKYITKLEYENPMAFTILAYKNLYQFQVLMKTLYVRSNFHCIHISQNAPIDIYTYALKLSMCLENVYLPDSRISMSWGDISILVAERLCQSLLLNKSSTWHYYMTIAGTELPIQTNLNRLQILQLTPDKSRIDVSSFPQPYNRQESKNASPPGNITVHKGEFHSILTRDFIQAVHTHPIALEFYGYLNETYVPDEQYYPSLVHLPYLPGAKARIVPHYVYTKLVSHYKIWSDDPSIVCQSNEFQSTICQFNYKDLANIEKSGRLFANKFNQENDLVGIDCWEKWLQLKQKYHQDINPRKYINKYPFMQRTEQFHHDSNANTATSN